MGCRPTASTTATPSTTLTTEVLTSRTSRTLKDDKVHGASSSFLLSAYLTFCTAPLFLFLNVVHIVHHYLSINKARVIIFPTLLMNTHNNWYSEILTAAVLRGGSLSVSTSRQVQGDSHGHGDDNIRK